MLFILFFAALIACYDGVVIEHSPAHRLAAMEMQRYIYSTTGSVVNVTEITTPTAVKKLSADAVVITVMTRSEMVVVGGPVAELYRNTTHDDAHALAVDSTDGGTRIWCSGTTFRSTLYATYELMHRVTGQYIKTTLVLLPRPLPNTACNHKLTST